MNEELTPKMEAIKIAKTLSGKIIGGPKVLCRTLGISGKALTHIVALPGCPIKHTEATGEYSVDTDEWRAFLERPALPALSFRRCEVI
jgi:hypothetical protein